MVVAAAVAVEAAVEAAVAVEMGAGAAEDEG